MVPKSEFWLLKSAVSRGVYEKVPKVLPQSYPPKKEK